MFQSMQTGETGLCSRSGADHIIPANFSLAYMSEFHRFAADLQ
jgi:hypothetical protein